MHTNNSSYDSLHLLSSPWMSNNHQEMERNEKHDSMNRNKNTISLYATILEICSCLFMDSSVEWCARNREIITFCIAVESVSKTNMKLWWDGIIIKKIPFSMLAPSYENRAIRFLSPFNKDAWINMYTDERSLSNYLFQLNANHNIM